MAKYIIQIIVVGTQLVSKAFLKALKQEYAASQHAASKAEGASRTATNATSNRINGLTLEEAKQILNVDRMEPSEISKRYEHLFQANDRSKGGSFYILSKVVRAKERLEEELQLKKQSNS